MPGIMFFKVVGEYRQSIKGDALLALDETDKYLLDVKKIFEVLRGRRKVGNTDKDCYRTGTANREKLNMAQLS